MIRQNSKVLIVLNPKKKFEECAVFVTQVLARKNEFESKGYIVFESIVDNRTLIHNNLTNLN